MSSDIEFDLDDEFEWVDADVIDEIEGNSNIAEDSQDEKHTRTIKNNDEVGRATDIKLYQFIAALSQIEHNFYSKDFSPQDLPFLSERISSNVDIAKKIAFAFDYKLNNLTHIYYFNILLKQVSFLSSAATLLGTRIEDSLEDNDYINKIKEVNVDGVVILEEELASNEVSMHIKSVLVPYCIYFESSISKVFTGISVGDYLEAVIEISKTIATKWNRSININKRHLLFVSVLDTVSRFVLNSIHRNVNELIESKFESSSSLTSTVWDKIERYDLGLRDFPSEKDILIDKVDSIINAEVNDFYIKHRTLNSLASKERARLWLISMLSDSWLSYHDSLISKLQTMSGGERQSYYNSNQNKPDLSDFYKLLSSDCKRHLTSIQSIKINTSDLFRSIRQEFSSLWGVSDAYCKTAN